MARLTENQLKRMVQSEYALAKRREVLNEARRELIVEQMIDEGLWDMIKQGAAGVGAAAAGAAKGGASMVGGAVAKAVEPLVNAGKAAKAAVGQIKDEAVKAAATAAAESLKNSLGAQVKQVGGALLKKLQASGLDEKEAKKQLGTIIGAAISAAVSDVMAGQKAE